MTFSSAPATLTVIYSTQSNSWHRQLSRGMSHTPHGPCSKLSKFRRGVNYNFFSFSAVATLTVTILPQPNSPHGQRSSDMSHTPIELLVEIVGIEERGKLGVNNKTRNMITKNYNNCTLRILQFKTRNMITKKSQNVVRKRSRAPRAVAGAEAPGITPAQRPAGTDAGGGASRAKARPEAAYAEPRSRQASTIGLEARVNGA